MMYNSFLSIVSVLQTPGEFRQLPQLLEQLYSVLEQHFSDFEIVLVNNTQGHSVDSFLQPLPGSIKQHIHLLNLAASTNKNHAIIAGLDRANGDYTVIFEPIFADQSQLVIELFRKAQQGFDIVYLRARERKVSLTYRFFYAIFYFLLRHYSSLKVDDRAHNTRIISRRALNSLLRLRENLRYMKAIYSIVGYHTSAIEVDKPLRMDPEENFSERFRTSLVAITSFTSFLRSLLLWIFILSFLFLIGVIINALLVKFTGSDILGVPQEAVSGWTFLVILISIFFAVTFLNLYIMSIYLSNIYYEIKQRPLYIIESVKRY